MNTVVRGTFTSDLKIELDARSGLKIIPVPLETITAFPISVLPQMKPASY
jgi:hypothetical protein